MAVLLEAGFNRSLRTDLAGFDGFSNFAQLSRVATPFPVGTNACQVTGSSNAAYLQKTIATTGVRQFSYRMYINLAAWPATGIIYRATTVSGVKFQILVSSIGKLIPEIGSTLGTGTATVLATGTGYRVEITGDSSTTTFSLAYKIYNMAGTLLETSTTQTLAGQTVSDIASVLAGQCSGVSTSFTFGSVKMTDSAADYPLGAGSSVDPVEPAGLAAYGASWVDSPSLIPAKSVLFGATPVMGPEVGALNIVGMQTAEGATKANRSIVVTQSCYETTAPDDLAPERMLMNGSALGHQCWPLINLLGDSTALTHDWPAGGITDFTNGLADALLDGWVTAINKLPATPVLLRLWREMNASGGLPWQGVGASTYVAAWRYVYTYITTRCPQARFVWCASARSGLADAAEFANYDPGDAYVHWRAIDAYGFAGTYIDTLAANFYNAYNQATGTISTARPMMMSETQDNVADGGRPAAYTAYGRILNTNFPLIKAVVFWDNVSTPFPINDTPAGSLAAFQGMAASAPFTTGLVGIAIEFSQDPLSDVTPSWVDVTRYCLALDWFGGKQRDLDDPQAGGATIRLRNDQRRFEPEYAAGAYYPNIVPLRRFRVTLMADGTAYPEGIYYATSWDVTYPARTAYSEVTVTCVDGFGILSLDLLPALDPPDAMLISDVIEFDQPFAYYRMDDLGGGTLIGRKKRRHHHHHHAPPPPPPPHRHRHHRHHHHHHHRHHGAGPQGTYISNPNPPVFSEPGLVIGDPDTSTLFRDADGCYAQIALSQGQFGSTNQFSIECLYKPISSLGGSPSSYVMAGPWNAGIGAHTFSLIGIIGSLFTITLNFTDGTFLAISSASPPTVGAAGHVCATWDGASLNLYINGVLENSNGSASGKKVRVGTASDFVYIGGSGFVGHNANGWIDEAAFYDRALTASRVQARVDAAFHRGYVEAGADVRVAAVLNTPLFAGALVDLDPFRVVPAMKTGQPKLDEIIHTVHASQPWALFFFDGSGNPVYHGWDYLGLLGSGDRAIPTATFGDTGGEVPYTDITLTYDDEIYNNATISGNSGVGQTASDTTSQAAYLTRSYMDTGLPLVSDTDAATVAQTIIDGWSTPMFRCDAITLNGAQSMSRTQILTREIGDLIRVRRRGTGGTPIDVITRILGKAKTFDTDGNLTCTWSLARGFNAADGYWHEGVTGFSELGQTTVLA